MLDPTPTPCWFDHVRFTGTHNFKHDKTIVTPSECAALCNEEEYQGQCETWEMRPSGVSNAGCWLKTSNKMEVLSKSTSGYKTEPCGTKLNAGYEVLIKGAGTTEVAFDVIACKHPIATQSECEKCGNTWKTTEIADGDTGVVWDT